MTWEMSHPVSFLVSVRQDKGEIEWRTQPVITPDKLVGIAGPGCHVEGVRRCCC